MLSRVFIATLVLSMSAVEANALFFGKKAVEAVPDRTQVRIQGLSSLTEEEALELLGDRLVFVVGREPTPPRAYDAAFLLQRALELQGRKGSQVTWKIPDTRTIVLIVREGQRIVRGEIKFIGALNKEEGDLFGKLMLQPVTKRDKTRQDEYPFLQEDIAPGLANVQQQLESQGWWGAKVTLKSQAEIQGRVNLEILVERGDQVTFGTQTVAVLPPNRQAESEVSALLAPFKGRVANVENLALARREVETYFSTRGYVDAAVTVEKRQMEREMRFLWTVTRGEPAQVREVRVTGLKKTRPERVQKRLQPLRGKLYDEKIAAERVNQLLQTGAFATARVEVVPAGPGLVDLELQTVEAVSRGLSVYGGGGNYEGPILGVNYYDRNLWGTLNSFTSALEVSGIGLLGDVRLTDPWLFDSEWSGSARLFTVGRLFDGFDQLKSGLELEAKRQFKHYSVALVLGQTYTTLKSNMIPEAELGLTDYATTALTIRQDLDYRDSKTVPRQGLHLQLDTELGLAGTGASVSYSKVQGLASYYIPIGERAHATLAVRGGFIDEQGESSLPIDLRFFIGGANTVRGFPERELGPKASTGDPLGGNSYVTFTTEYVQPFSSLLRGVVFLDGGTLAPVDVAIDPQEFRYSAGLGLRVDLPVGPLRLDYGVNLNPGEGDPFGAFHFSVGVAF